MLIGSMVHDQVDQHAHPTLLAAVGELDKVAQSPVAGIDAIIIGHIITVISAGRGLKGHQPHGGGADSLKIIQTAH